MSFLKHQKNHKSQNVDNCNFGEIIILFTCMAETFFLEFRLFILSYRINDDVLAIALLVLAECRLVIVNNLLFFLLGLAVPYSLNFCLLLPALHLFYFRICPCRLLYVDNWSTTNCYKLFIFFKN